MADQNTTKRPPVRSPFRRAPIAVVVASLGLLASGSIRAADDDAVAKLQAEVDRARAEIAQLHEQLQRQHDQAAPSNRTAIDVASSAAVATAAPAPNNDQQIVGTAKTPAASSVAATESRRAIRRRRPKRVNSKALSSAHAIAWRFSRTNRFPSLW
jgi:hypothetical protein